MARTHIAAGLVAAVAFGEGVKRGEAIPSERERQLLRQTFSFRRFSPAVLLLTTYR